MRTPAFGRGFYTIAAGLLVAAVLYLARGCGDTPRASRSSSPVAVEGSPRETPLRNEGMDPGQRRLHTLPRWVDLPPPTAAVVEDPHNDAAQTRARLDAILEECVDLAEVLFVDCPEVPCLVVLPVKGYRSVNRCLSEASPAHGWSESWILHVPGNAELAEETVGVVAFGSPDDDTDTLGRIKDRMRGLLDDIDWTREPRDRAQ